MAVKQRTSATGDFPTRRRSKCGIVALFKACIDRICGGVLICSVFRFNLGVVSLPQQAVDGPNVSMPYHASLCRS